jgi:aryl-alcohol dehydrogenase-like predicted oxidoreductase
MERRLLGKTDISVSALGFGGAEIGFQHAGLQTVERLLNTALDAGLNAIDTAECYNESEELIGQAVGNRRNDYFLFTKCGHASGFDLPDWDPRLLEQSVERSLKRLRTDHLDVVHLHTCSEEVLRRGEAIQALQRMKAAGKTRFIGYSGDGQAAKYAVQLGVFDTLETSVSIADQEAIALTLPLAKERGMGILAKRPLANVAWLKGESESNYGHVYWQRLQALDYDFLRGDQSEAVGVAIRFTLTVPEVGTAIVGTTKLDRWQENARLLQAGPLSAEEYEAIRSRWREVAEPGWVGQG